MQVAGLIVGVCAAVAYIALIPLAFILRRRGDRVPAWMRLRVALIGLAAAGCELLIVFGRGTESVVALLVVLLALAFWSAHESQRFRWNHGGAEEFQRKFVELEQKVRERENSM